MLKEDRSFKIVFRFSGITAFGFANGLICSNLGTYIIPIESDRLSSNLYFLSYYWLIVGITQIICLYIGHIAHHHNHVYILLVLTVLAIISNIILYISSLYLNIISYFIGILLIQIVLSAVYTLQYDIIRNWIETEEEQHSCSTYLALNNYLGSLVGFIIISTSFLEVQHFYLINGFVFMIASIAVIYNMRRKDKKYKNKCIIDDVINYDVSLFEVLKDESFFILFLSRCLYNSGTAVSTMYFFYIKYILKTTNIKLINLELAGYIIISKICATLICVWFVSIDIINKKRISLLMYSTLCTAFIYLIFLVSPFLVNWNYIITLILIGILGLFNGVYRSSEYAVALSLINNANLRSGPARILALWVVSSNIGISFGPFLYSYIIPHILSLFNISKKFIFTLIMISSTLLLLISSFLIKILHKFV